MPLAGRKSFHALGELSGALQGCMRSSCHRMRSSEEQALLGWTTFWRNERQSLLFRHTRSATGSKN